MASDLWILDLDTGTMSRLTATGSVTSVEWAGSRDVVFTATSDSLRAAVWRQDASGVSPPRMLHQATEALTRASAAPDGRSLVIQVWTGVSWDIQRVPLDSTPTRPLSLLASEANEAYPRISPNGRWIAYTSDETGQEEVYVRSFPDPSTKVQVSNAGGAFPAWSPDGLSLYYATGGRVIEARLATSSGVRVVSRDSAFTTPNVPNVSNLVAFGWFEPTRDRNRMLMLSPESVRYDVIAVPNWLAEFRARTAGKK